MDINALYEKSRDGTKDAEEALFQALSVRFHLFVSRKVMNEEDGKEIVQDALMTISANYRNIEFTTSFSAWSYKVLQNRILNYFKMKKRHVISYEAEPTDNKDLSRWSGDPQFTTDLLDCLAKIGRTNRTFARALSLKFQGYAAEEICRKLEVTPGNFYVIVSRARSLLKKCLERGI